MVALLWKDAPMAHFCVKDARFGICGSDFKAFHVSLVFFLHLLPLSQSTTSHEQIVWQANVLGAEGQSLLVKSI